MRIAEVAPAHVHPYSGVLTVVIELSCALAKRGHSVELWQLSPWPDEGTAGLRASLEQAGVELVPCHVKGAMWLGGEARRAVATRSPDVMHLHNSFSPANNLLARHLTVPYIVTAHGGYSAEQLAYRRWRKAAFKHLFDKPMLAGAAAVVALTEAEASEIRAIAPETQPVVVPNAVSPPPQVDGRAFRRRIGIHDERLVVYAGKLDLYHKRVAELVDGVAATTDWHLALVGPDWRGGRARLVRQTSALGARSRVHFVDPLRGSELHEAYAAADVFGLISRWEGLSISLLEAMAHATPAVVSPEVEQRLGVAAAGAGWAAEPDRLGAVLSSLSELPADDWERTRKGARGYAGRNSWDDIAGRYEELLGAVAMTR